MPNEDQKPTTDYIVEIRIRETKPDNTGLCRGAAITARVEGATSASAALNTILVSRVVQEGREAVNSLMKHLASSVIKAQGAAPDTPDGS